jgi:ADP-ribose pyrophosphatase
MAQPRDVNVKPQILAEGRFLRLLSHRGWEWAERTNTAAAVVVVAVTPERQLVLVEQYRIPLGRRVIELPAGLVGDQADTQGEDLIEAARRELLEETGFQAERIERLVDGPSSSGMTNETYALLLARNARPVGPGGGDSTEDIQVHIVPLDQVDAWLESKRQQGVMVDPRVYAGIHFANR